MVAMRVVADREQVGKILERMGREVAETMAQSEGPWAIVGIRCRGDDLAGRLAERLRPEHTGSVDIALYRDDLSEVGPQPVVRTTELPFPVDGTNVLLVDDVLMTGRSVRAAVQSLIDFGRPRCVKLAVLVDRGGRELPVAPDFVGQRLNADAGWDVQVRLVPTDSDDAILLIPRETQPAGGEPAEASLW